MQQEGDELDKKIKIAEKEIVAIENTLKMVNLTNVAFKNNLSPLKENDVEIQEMKVLNSSLKESTTKLRDAKQDYEGRQQAFDELLNKAKDIENEHTQKKALVKELEEQNMFIENQDKVHEERLKRTENQLRKATKQLERRDLSIYEQDLQIRQLKEANHDVQKKLSNMAAEYLDIAPNIKKYSEEQNIDLKSQGSSTSFSSVSSVPSSSRSDSTVSSNSLLFQIQPIAVNKIDINY